jgi:hypothetical protein
MTGICAKGAVSNRRYVVTADRSREQDPDFKLNLYRLQHIPRDYGPPAAAPAFIAAIWSGVILAPQ